MVPAADTRGIGSVIRMSDDDLSDLLHEDRIFPPSAEFAASANVTSDIYPRAAADHLAFWEQQANRLDWDTSWSQVLDWSDADLGDRHCDVARSLLIFWIAPIIAESTVERIALRLSRGYLQWQYQRAYERHVELDADRLAYWKALQAFGGWQLVTRVQDPEGEESVDLLAGDHGEHPKLGQRPGRRSS